MQRSVKIRSELGNEIHKYQSNNVLRLLIFTGCGAISAPIVCVDIYERSVKVGSVDG